MELVLELKSGETVRIGINADGQPEAIAHPLFPAMVAMLAPDCEQSPYMHTYGDCDGRIRKRYVIEDFFLGARHSERVWLCGNHGRQAAQRKQVAALDERSFGS